MKIEQIIPEKLDLVMRDEDFAIYYNGKPMLTPGGETFTHANARVLKHILLKMNLNAAVHTEKINSTCVFIFLHDKILKDNDFVLINFDNLFDADFIVRARIKADAIPLPQQATAIEYLTEHPYVMSLMLWSNSVILEGLRSFLSGIGFDDNEGDEATIKDLVRSGYEALLPEQKSGVNLLSLHHQNGLILPMMLVLGYITPSEYANSTFTAHARHSLQQGASVYENTIGKYDIQPLTPDSLKPMSFVKDVHQEALEILEFLGFFVNGHRKISVINELISQGEGDQVEFKSTFRWDIRQGKKNPAIEHASLKTIAAFLNSDGGDLLIGVEDDGNIIGVELDNFPNDDKFLLHLWSLIKSSIGQDVSPFIKTTLEKFDGKTVCRVHCEPSPKPIFLRQKGFDESFYIRIGPSSGSLEISEALKYIADRFKS
jgi:hypothetical protein